ncbi:DUF5058 family protein [Domibacillus epiphyticus]|uniref:DUF5058 domain-containing protein n=1 Tax=Domibacillus epiphyticus TaxID=1714355 RepID=A0A1V2A5L7_9BACI|nr:DUF5058 family protein [Domibacillus epiphyticus]OMP66305.1 DUF5058 domain-containing protein [Domibacillus epiphyticus]
MEKAMQVATSFPVWVFAIIVIGIVVFQAIIFIKLAVKTSQSVGMTRTEVKSALKVGAINAIGPAMGSMIIAISLITFLAEPITLMRSGVIGSSAIESAAASLAAGAYGTELGASDFNEQAFTTVVWTLCLGGLGWLLVIVFFTKSFGKAQNKVAMKSGRGKVNLMAVISSAAMIGVFANLASGEVMKGFTNSIVVITSAISMYIILFIANKRNLTWVKEWSLGLSILAALSVGYMMTL